MVDIVLDDFYALIGKAVTRWSIIDRHVYQIFQVAIGVEERLAAIAYTSQAGLYGRLKLTSATIAAVADGEINKEFNSIKTSIEEAARTRNLLAHGTTVFYSLAHLFTGDDQFEDANIPTDWFRVLRPLHEDKGLKALQRKEIEEHIDSIGDLGVRLENFRWALIEWVTLHRSAPISTDSL